ncbi:MAG: MFS transporter [Gluconacetobacter liquefaciens]
MREKSWIVLILLLAPINFLMSLDRHAISIAMPVIRKDLGFSVAEASFILSCATWGYSLLQPLSGWLAERMGPRRVLFGAAFLWSLATFVSPLCLGFAPFLLARFGMGAAQAPDWASSMLVLKQRFAAASRSRANALLLGFIYLGSIVSGPLTSWLMLAYSWKLAFALFGAFGIAISVYWLVCYRDPPESIRGAVVPVEAGAGRGELLRAPRFWLVGFLYFCTICVQGFYASWFPTWLHEVHHVRLKDLGWLSSAPWAALYVSVLLAGVLADRLIAMGYGLRLVRTGPSVLALALSAGLLAVAGHVHGTAPALILMTGCLGAIGFVQVSLWSAVQDISGRYTGFVTGCTAFWGSLSASLVPLGVGGIVTWSGGSWADVLLLPAVAAAAGAVGFFWLRPDRPLLDAKEHAGGV